MLLDTVKPLDAAAPPDALVTSEPDTLNWNPYISASLSYKISTVASAQLDPSPPHSPHSSNSAEPAQSPAQSTSAVQLPSQSKFSSAYVHVPSSSVASALKLQANASVQPKTSELAKADVYCELP